MVKRCYIVWVGDEEIGLSVVAESLKQAKTLTRRTMEMDFGLDDFIDLNARWVKKADVSKFEIGHIFEGEKGLMEGLLARAYDFLTEGKCKKCGALGDIRYHKDPPHALCEDCYDECEEGK